MSQTVYVGNIPWSLTQEELSEYMSQTGQVEQVVIPQYRGRSKGFGIVTYTTQEAASRAISVLDGSVLHERTIVVRENEREQSARIFVGNLSWDVTWQELKDHFRQVGEAVFADVLTNYNGSSKGCGIVEFESSKQAQEAIVMLNNSELKGRQIFVREERSQQQNDQSGNFNKRRNSRPKTQRSNFNNDRSNFNNERSGFNNERSNFNNERSNFNTRRKNSNNYRNYNDTYNSDTQYQAQYVEPVEPSDISHRVFVSNLSYRLQWQELKDYMRSAGFVTNVNIFKNPYDGRSKGFGTVEFRTAEEAQNAIITLNSTELQGRTISVQADKGQPKSKSNFNDSY